MKKVWTIEMEDLLRNNYPVLPTEDIFKLLPGQSKSSIKSKVSYMKLRKKGKLHTWRYEDELKLSKIYHNTLNAELGKVFGRSESAISGAAFKLGLKKTAEFMRFHALKTAFKPGNMPFNKGKKQTEYMSAEAINNTKATRFKMGGLPATAKGGPGTITVRYDNRNKPYQFICIEFGEWIALHTYNWEKVNGKVPNGHCLWFKDQDSMNPELSNLELITRAENVLRNSGSINLPDGMVASYMAKESYQVNYELRDEYLKHPELIQLKRNQLLLNRELNKRK